MCLGVVKPWPRSLPWTCQSKQIQEHLSMTLTSQSEQVALNLNLVKEGVSFPHSVWSGLAGREKSV